jgi:hypothetical protein
MLHKLLAGQGSPIAWFYTPMALPLLEEVEAQHVVYDCMDELSAFKNAPAKLFECKRSINPSLMGWLDGGESDTVDEIYGCQHDVLIGFFGSDSFEPVCCLIHYEGE